MRFIEGISLEAFFTRLHKIIHSLYDRLSLFEVIRQGLVEFRQSVLEELLYHLSNLFMDILTFLLEQAIVNNFLCQGVLEDIFQVGLNGPHPDEIEPLQTHQAPVNVLFELCNTIENLIEKGPADY